MCRFTSYTMKCINDGGWIGILKKLNKMMLKKGNTFTRTHKKHTVGKRDGHVSFGQSKHDHTLKLKNKTKQILLLFLVHRITTQARGLLSSAVSLKKVRSSGLLLLTFASRITFLFFFSYLLHFIFTCFVSFLFLFLFLYLFFLFTVIQKKENWLSLKRNRKNKN